MICRDINECETTQFVSNLASFSEPKRFAWRFTNVISKLWNSNLPRCHSLNSNDVWAACNDQDLIKCENFLAASYHVTGHLVEVVERETQNEKD